jgi:hypothetical protein
MPRPQRVDQDDIEVWLDEREVIVAAASLSARLRIRA